MNPSLGVSPEIVYIVCTTRVVLRITLLSTFRAFYKLKRTTSLSVDANVIVVIELGGPL